MRGPLWSAADDEELRQLYVDPSVSREELEQRFGRSWMAIKSRANTFGLYRRSPRPLSSHAWTEDEERLLRELYPDLSNSRQEIAQRLGRTWRACQHKVHELGIGDTRARNNPCQVRRDYFKVIDSDEKAYWLGFIAADGVVYIGGRQHTVRIDLQPRDLHWLQRFRDIIAPGMQITKHGDRSYSFGIGSQELVTDLLALGITPRKSNTLEWPKVPESLVMPYPFRGCEARILSSAAESPGAVRTRLRVSKGAGDRRTLRYARQWLCCASGSAWRVLLRVLEWCPPERLP